MVKFAKEMHRHLRHVGDVLGIPNLKMRIGLHLGHFVRFCFEIHAKCYHFTNFVHDCYVSKSIVL